MSLNIVHGETAMGSPVEQSDDGLFRDTVFAVINVFSPVDIKHVFWSEVHIGTLRSALTFAWNADVGRL